MQLYYLDPFWLYFLTLYYETDVMLYYAWSRSLFLEVGQAHSKYNLLLLLYYYTINTHPHSTAVGLCSTLVHIL